jgi:hypothetical protein
MDREVLREANELRHSLERDYDAIRDRVSERVTRWEWDALGTWREIPVPHWAELHELPPKPSRPREQAPKRLNTAVHYGLDRDGIVVAARNYMSASEVTDERFVERSADRVLLYAYRRRWPGGPLGTAAVSVGRVEDGRVITWATSSSDTVFSVFALDYDGDRVMRVDMVSREPGGENEEQYSFAFTYGPTGELARVSAEYGIVYQASDSQPAAEAMAEVMARAIAAAATQCAPAQPSFALVVLYDYATLLPFDFGFITEAAVARETNAPERAAFWNPADHHFVADPPYAFSAGETEFLQVANVTLRQTDSDEALREIALLVARELQSATWPQEFARSADFIVVAVDADQADVGRNLRDLLDSAGLAEHRARAFT